MGTKTLLRNIKAPTLGNIYISVSLCLSLFLALCLSLCVLGLASSASTHSSQFTVPEAQCQIPGASCDSMWFWGSSFILEACKFACIHVVFYGSYFFLIA